MTRRERMTRLADNFGDHRQRWELEGMIARHGIAGLLSDDALDELAARLVRAEKQRQEMNRRNRAVRAAHA